MDVLNPGKKVFLHSARQVWNDSNSVDGPKMLGAMEAAMNLDLVALAKSSVLVRTVFESVGIYIMGTKTKGELFSSYSFTLDVLMFLLHRQILYQ